MFSCFRLLSLFDGWGWSTFDASAFDNVDGVTESRIMIVYDVGKGLRARVCQAISTPLQFLGHRADLRC